MKFNLTKDSKIIVFTGAGMSAESGISTFRDSNGLWENYRIEEVATPQAFANNPYLVIDFYNQRRKNVLEAEPNQGHLSLNTLESHYPRTVVITQNIDDLHERAGSKNIIHLHGEITKLRSSKNPSYIETISTWEQKTNHLCPEGSVMRPDIVWFGEEVPKMVDSELAINDAELMIVVGTSLQVYPAANLLYYVPENCPIIYIDPAPYNGVDNKRIRIIKDKAGNALPVLVQELIKSLNPHG